MSSAKFRKVFVDRNIRVRSVTTEGARLRKEIQFGPTKQEIEIVGWRRKAPRGGDHSWVSSEIECLPTVAHLATDGVVALYESNEVRCESFSASIGARGTKGDIFRNAPIQQTNEAVERSYFGSRTIDQIADRQDVIEFCRFLRNVTPSQLQEIPGFLDRLPNAMKANILKLARFHALIDALPTERQWPDALHLWTAETHEAEYFLTLDRRFINALTKTARIDLPTKPLVPSELLNELGVKDRVSLPVADFDFHDFF